MKVIATLSLYTLHVGTHRPVASYSKSCSSDYCGHDPIQNQVAISAGNSKHIYIHKGDTMLSIYLAGGTQDSTSAHNVACRSNESRLD